MGLIETEETNKFTFEPFAAHPFYTEVNRGLVRQALAHLSQQDTGAPVTIVDMACGTGAVSRLIIEEMERQGKLSQLRLIGVDPSAEALRRAQKGVDQMGLPADVKFIQGESEDLPKLIQNANAAFFCNAIHLLTDKLSAFKQVASILAPQGIFACNSAFYTGTYVPGTERFYRLWTRRAVAWLRQEHPDVRLSREAKAAAMQWVTSDDYVQIYQESGFGKLDMVQDTAIISLDAWRDLGQYWLFIDGALPGIPLAYGARALEVAVYQAGEELELQEVPRNWLQMVGIKK
ncbi:class I SAM-dependent methyltransferase [Ktedonobacter racemifer]|uniref:Methyltransferase type 11 n=1 Tax=Ktedonobacter racemifer DSM 44963 TaxID=485913 RepID=D6U6X1_KTERA|nr:class I SAM-dependent methyltransferase [Ktedonobacter racemifer]EFH80732.1 Methyltransferase type 11 [Ktedonobacter racemifer DSM 44963]